MSQKNIELILFRQLAQYLSLPSCMIDANGNLAYADYKRMGKRGVMIGFTTMGHMMSTLIRKLFGKFPLIFCRQF